MKFENNKISHEHIYWDQASVLVQTGLLKAEQIPITGIEQTKKLVELSKKD
jgi:carboxymethylenebutenolidase